MALSGSKNCVARSSRHADEAVVPPYADRDRPRDVGQGPGEHSRPFGHLGLLGRLPISPRDPLER
eukprot:6701249-Alexandrium_andersonii.AAC.1